MTTRQWQNITDYMDTVGTTLKTFTFNKTQNYVNVTIRGNANVTYSIGSQSGTLTPGQSISVSEKITSFTLTAASGTQTVEVWATEDGTQKVEDDSSDSIAGLASSLADMTKRVKTVSDLVSALTQGINLVVKNGTYTLNSDITSMSNGIVIEGENNTIIDGGAHSINIANLQNVTFKNIIFQNFANLQLTTPTNIVFDKCQFNNFTVYGINLSNYSNIKFINRCSWNGIGSTSVDPTYQGAAIYANNGDKLIVEDFEMQNTYGQGAIFLVGGATNYSIKRFSIHDTQYRGYNNYTGTYSGIIERGEIYNCGILRPPSTDQGATTGHGVGCNGVYAYATSDQSGVVARDLRIRNVYENGMECGFGLIENIEIENTATDLANHYTPSIEGLWIQNQSYLKTIRNVRIHNSAGDGIKFFDGSNAINNLHIYNVTVEDDNANLSHYGVDLNSGVSYSNVIIDGLTVYNKTPIFMASKPCTMPVYVSGVRSIASGVSMPVNAQVRTKDGLILNAIQNKDFSNWTSSTALANWANASANLSQVADDNSYIPQLTVTSGGFSGRITQDVYLPKGQKSYYLRVMFKGNTNLVMKFTPYNIDGTTLGTASTLTTSSFSSSTFQEATFLIYTTSSKAQLYFGTQSSTQGDNITIQSIQERVIY